MKKNWIKKLIIIGLLVCQVLVAHGVQLNQHGLVSVCEVDGLVITEHEPPEFSNDGCEVQNIVEIDPQNRLLWVAIDLELDLNALKELQPLGLFLSGKSSSKVYLNDHYLGNNGHPAINAIEEKAGAMDAVFHVPYDELKSANNRVVMLLSAHQGLLQLSHPINGMSMGTYHRPNDAILRYYWPSLLPFGVLLLGGFYLLLMTVFNHLPRHVFLLPVMAILAATQLFVEVSRGLYAYPYTFHDYRLLMVLFCSLGFGCCLLAYVLHLLPIKKRLMQWLFIVVPLLLLIWAVPGYDYKSISAIVVPIAVALVYLFRAWYLSQPNVRFVSLLLLVFFMMVFMNAYSFIDTVYYYFVAALIFLLMTQQAKQASQAKQMQLKYQARADQLQQVIDQQSIKDSNDKIEIRSAGKVEWVLIKDIAFCKGAGDYVELVLVNGENKLFYGSLTELSLRLPTIFLKTHRSYLVNTTLISSLERNNSGSSHLILSQGEVVPISRRILPQVKQQLT